MTVTVSRWQFAQCGSILSDEKAYPHITVQEKKISVHGIYLGAAF